MVIVGRCRRASPTSGSNPARPAQRPDRRLGAQGATEVRFGGRPAPSFTIRSAIQIVAQAPAGEGTVDVTVTTPAGTSRSGYGDLFTYRARPIGPIMSGCPALGGHRPAVGAHRRRRRGARRGADASGRLHAPVTSSRATTRSPRALLRQPAQAAVRSSRRRRRRRASRRPGRKREELVCDRLIARRDFGCA